MHIPTFRTGSRMKMMRFTAFPLPFPSSQQSDRRKYAMALPEQHLLAISSDDLMYQTFSDSDWQRCETRLGVTYCRDNNLYDKRLESSCLVALYRRDKWDIATKWRWKMELEEDIGLQVGPTESILYQVTQEAIKMKWPQHTE